MARPKQLEMTALGGLLLQVVFLIACLAMGGWSGSPAVSAQVWYVGIGILVWFMVLVHGRQRRLAREEGEELERLKSVRLSREIFEDTELDTSRASSGLLVFEKYFVPFFSVVLSGLLLFFAFRIARANWAAPEYEVINSEHVLLAMAFVSFFGFLVGKYAAGLAQIEGLRLLRAAGGYLMGNVIMALLTAGAMAMYFFGITWGERVIAFAVPLVMGLVGVEVLLNLMLDIYRPRVAGQETRPPYDSRLLGLFAEPQGVLKTVAATLDYQFGFKVSDTWFYHFMERAIVPLLLVQVTSLWLLTTLLVVEQHEIAFVERLGQPYVTTADKLKGLKATVLQPGFHLKLPWPLSVARRVPAHQVHDMEIGKVREAPKGPRPILKVAEDTDIILWRELHVDPKEGFEASFLVPSTVAIEPVEATAAAAGAGAEDDEAAGSQSAPAVNLARLEGHVYYRVKRAPGGGVDEHAAFTCYYHETDIRTHLEKLAYRAICRVAASEDFMHWLADGRAEVAQKWHDALSLAVEQDGLGVEVVDVSINAVHPPAEVARAYEQVVAALQERESRVLEGELERIRLSKGATARRAEVLSMAKAYAYRERALAKADADMFLVRLDAYGVAPQVYVTRTYFDSLEEALKGQRVFVVPVSESEVQIIDLQERLRASLLEDLDALEG